MTTPIEASRILNSNAMYPGNVKDLICDDLDFNCYGFTAYMANWIDEIEWLDEDTMSDFLERRTIVIDDPCEGAIAVMRQDGYLTHTAIVYAMEEEPLIVHKPAASPLEVISLDDMNKEYAHWGEVTEFRYPLEQPLWVQGND